MVGASRAAAARGQLYTAFARIERAPMFVHLSTDIKLMFVCISGQLLTADISSSQNAINHVILRKKNNSSLQLWRVEAN
jgi:hypothetical protein